ncbi:hypothetical protein C8Q80DRAFT_1342601, partial [Daedaleopsis nitida]
MCHHDIRTDPMYSVHTKRRGRGWWTGGGQCEDRRMGHCSHPSCVHTLSSAIWWLLLAHIVIPAIWFKTRGLTMKSRATFTALLLAHALVTGLLTYFAVLSVDFKTPEDELDLRQILVGTMTRLWATCYSAWQVMQMVRRTLLSAISALQRTGLTMSTLGYLAYRVVLTAYYLLRAPVRVARQVTALARTLSETIRIDRFQLYLHSAQRAISIIHRLQDRTWQTNLEELVSPGNTSILQVSVLLASMQFRLQVLSVCCLCGSVLIVSYAFPRLALAAARALKETGRGVVRPLRNKASSVVDSVKVSWGIFMTSLKLTTLCADAVNETHQNHNTSQMFAILSAYVRSSFRATPDPSLLDLKSSGNSLVHLLLDVVTSYRNISASKQTPSQLRSQNTHLFLRHLKSSATSVNSNGQLLHGTIGQGTLIESTTVGDSTLGELGASYDDSETTMVQTAPAQQPPTKRPRSLSLGALDWIKDGIEAVRDDYNLNQTLEAQFPITVDASPDLDSLDQVLSTRMPSGNVFRRFLTEWEDSFGSRYALSEFREKTIDDAAAPPTRPRSVGGDASCGTSSEITSSTPLRSSASAGCPAVFALPLQPDEGQSKR